MKQNDEKAVKYLEGNPLVAKFVDDVNQKIKEYYEKSLPSLKPEFVTVDVGNKFIRLWKGSTCWGFISRVDGDLKGAPIKKGDLLKAASWKSPAKHARGNIIEGTARYGVYGPEYLM